MGIENIVESERRICVVQHSSIPLTSIDIGNISFINVIENIDRVIEFMRNITIGNNSNIGGGIESFDIVCSGSNFIEISKFLSTASATTKEVLGKVR